MTWLFLLVAIFLGLAFLITKTKKPKISATEPPPYFKKPALLNNAERELFQRLKEAAPGHHVMTQVTLSNMIDIKKTKNRQSWFNKMQNKSADFVICAEDFDILLAVELDGPTHDRKDRQHSDRTKEEILKAAGIALLRIKADKIPSTPELRKLLLG